MRGRKVYGQVVCTFRYGREEDEVMGLNFYKELFLASEQIYPPPEKKNYELSKTQVNEIRIYATLAFISPVFGHRVSDKLTIINMCECSSQATK